MVTETSPAQTRPMDRQRDLAANKTSGRPRRISTWMPPPQVSLRYSSSDAFTAVQTGGAAADGDRGAPIVKASMDKRVRAKLSPRMRSRDGCGDVSAVDKADTIMIKCCFISLSPTLGFLVLVPTVCLRRN